MRANKSLFESIIVLFKRLDKLKSGVAGVLIKPQERERSNRATWICMIFFINQTFPRFSSICYARKIAQKI